MLSSVYLVEYTLHQNLMIEIHTRNFDLHITVPSPNLAFLCRNLDYKPYSIILYSQLTSKIDIFWSNVDHFTVVLLLQNSSDFEMCSLMWDNDIMLTNKFSFLISFLYLGQVVCVEYRHKHIVKFYQVCVLQCACIVFATYMLHWALVG